MEKDKWGNIVAAAVLIAVGLLSLGLTLRNGIVHFKDSDRIVNVKGLSEMEVNADKVIWPLMYKEVGDNLSDLYEKMETTNSKIVNFLVTNGLNRNDITIAAPEVIDMRAQQYIPEGVKYRYNITAVMTVASSQVDLVRKLMSEQSDLLKQGIAITGGDYRYSTQFLFTGLNEIKPQMIEEATKNARLAAEKFAKDSDSKLGKIKYANQGQFSISNRDENTPYIKTVRVVTSLEYYLKD